MTNFAIERDKKPPVAQMRHRYPWSEMKPGQCFRFTEHDDEKRARRVTSCRVSGMRYFKRRGGRFTVVITETGSKVKVSVVLRAR